MSAIDINQLKARFATGDQPTQKDFTDLIDTLLAQANAALDVFKSSSQALPGNLAAITFDHNLDGVPTFTPSATLVCISTDADTGYAAGDELDLKQAFARGADDLANPAFTISADAAQVVVRRYVASNTIMIAHKTTGVPSAIGHEARWNLKVVAAFIP